MLCVDLSYVQSAVNKAGVNEGFNARGKLCNKLIPSSSSKPHPPIRTFKIEADGDLWKGLVKPKIRLTGRWLERAGFKPGNRVHVACVAPGVIELRSPDAGTVIGTMKP